LLHQIDVLGGGIEEFVGKEVPHLTTRFIRRWSEAKGPEIQTFLVNFTQRIASDFGNTFAAPLELASLPKSLVTPELDVAHRKITIDRTQDVIYGHLLPTAVPMAAGFLFLGPLGLLAGSLLGQIAGVKIRETRLEAQKSEASDIVTREVRTAIEGFRNALHGEIQRWFDTLLKLLRNGIQERSNRAYRQLSQSGSLDLGSLERIREDLLYLEQELNKE